jgi:hypothetical protein
MLENIKLILNLTDDKYDQLILLYISKVENVIMSYCNIDKLNLALESFIEDKVVSIMKSKVGGGAQNTGEIKSVSRGDTKIEYNVGDIITDTSNGANLTSSEMIFLNKFRKLRCF